MKIRLALLTAVSTFAFRPLAQTSAIDPAKLITMNQEPHHHLAFHNDFINVFNVEVAPGGSIALHRHDDDTVAIAIGDQEVTVGIPGKPDVHQKNTDGQVRLQRTDYAHSTHVDGSTAYHTVAVELLRAQTHPRNVCAAVAAGPPLDCPHGASLKSKSEVEFESDQTRIRMVHIPSRGKVQAEDGQRSQLIVALDPVHISPASGKGPDHSLQAGDFAWIEKGASSRWIRNNGPKESRVVEISIAPTP